MEDHDDGHDQGDDVHEGGGALEDDGICELNVASVAFWFYADAQLDIGDASDDGAEWYGCTLAYPLEITEAAHVEGM